MLQDYEKIIDDFSKKLPKFPDGRIDFTNSDSAPVFTCFVMFDKKILLLKRSEKVANYKGMWNSVAGFLDSKTPLAEKIYEELTEELGILKKDVLEINLKKCFELNDKKINKTWIIFPALVKLKKLPKIKLDWEHTEFKWIEPKDINKFEIVPGLDKNLKKAMK